MSFNILYVENDHKHWARIQEAVKAFNNSSKPELLIIDRAENPEQMKQKLFLHFDLVIADVFYDDPETGEPDKINGLDEIIKYIKEWNTNSKGGRLLPVIVYTGFSKEALGLILNYENSLYDIWDKNTATPEYVAWRLSKISNEVARIHPDAKLQRYIRDITKAASWNEYVKEMARRYDQGLTEQDQIEKVENPIVNIARSIGVPDVCKPLWNVMVEWESLSRSASRKVRGHARHVINVFWLGYCLLHSEPLRDFFVASWEKLKKNRSEMGDVYDLEPMEVLSNAWFLAGLFHDVGGCIEKAVEVNKKLSEVLSAFGDLAPPSTMLNNKNELLLKLSTQLFSEFDEVLAEYMQREFEKSLQHNKPDQGIVAAIHLRNSIRTGPQRFYAREGGRAAALHNLFPTLNEGKGQLPISWDTDPIVCLLILCDQLQTWDRERGDETRWDDKPYRAELSDLTIESGKEKPKVNISIDYIAPVHLTYAGPFYEREKDRLDDVLQSHPEHALRRIQGPWPFKLSVQFYLSGDPLSTTINLE